MQHPPLRKDLESIDPGLFELIQLEDERQERRLIMIPSESIASRAVRQLLGSSFTNIYAEGYPRSETIQFHEDEIFNYTNMIGTYRRYSDPRYYKGVEYVDVVEALARRRCCETFAANGLTGDDLFVNVQALSGAPANNAVYSAFLSPGDTILGMNLLHGGHLSHGSSVNRSGILFNAQHYSVDPKTECLDYDAIHQKALETHPKIIVAGYSSYPWVPDWKKFREIADSVGALLLTDISHIAGLIAAGQIPSPVGIAQIITFTTHKTLLGPRGACIITDNPTYAKKIDKAVFPGEQGGPHINNIAALALTLQDWRKPKVSRTSRGRSSRTQLPLPVNLRNEDCAFLMVERIRILFCWIVNQLNLGRVSTYLVTWVPVFLTLQELLQTGIPSLETDLPSLLLVFVSAQHG